MAEVTGRNTALEQASARSEQGIPHDKYRTCLFTDVVTGKLDVRETAARLQGEDEEPEPLDEADDLIEVEAGTSDNLDAAPEEAQA